MKRFSIAAVVLTLLAFAATAGRATASAPVGAVYALSNAAGGNTVLAYDRAADGSIAAAGSYATGGNGTGGTLGSQGSVTLSDDGRYLLAVNGGSNTVSAFAVSAGGLELLNAVSSGGTLPVSVDVHKGVVYVVNADSRTISGFTLGRDGLAPLAGSTRALGASAAVISQLSFSPSGDVLVVTERGSNTIDTFAVDGDGYASAALTFPSSGNAPFGFDWDNKGHLIVSDANNGPGNSAATSYDVSPFGAVSLITGPVSTFQGAACWLVTSNDGRYAFTANAGAGSISTFSVAPDGSLSLAGTTAIGAGSHPLDEAVSNNGRFLYVVADGVHRLAGYRIASDGSLEPAGSAPLPANAAGLAAS
jgi:6-phosphogluconolactonase (cycloisomerase 2 family)